MFNAPFARVKIELTFPIWFLAHDQREPFFVILLIFVLLHSFASLFSKSTVAFSAARDLFRRDFVLHRPFSPGCEDTSSVLAVVFMRLLSLFLHPDIAVANLSRPILSRMARNNSRGTATSAIWKAIFPEWRTTFAPILISFSRNVVSVQ